MKTAIEKRQKTLTYSDDPEFKLGFCFKISL